MKTIRTFKTKKDVFSYVKKKFSKKSKLILVRGSTANKPVKKFSDLDIEIYCKQRGRPYYELAFVKNKLVLITVYPNLYKKGKQIKPPRGVKVIYGKYNNKIKPLFGKDTYTPKQKIKRECQIAMDLFFKYLRTGNKKYLQSVQKRIT